MKTRSFGNLDYQVPVIGFGGAAISGEGGGYGFGEISAEKAEKLLHRALEAGITLFDTAPIYGFGLSEKRIGKAFSKKREKVFIVSKCGITWDDNKWVRIDNSPETVERMLGQSLKDLETDYIDLYMIHWPDRNVDIRKPMEVLQRAKECGKIKSIGLCNTNADDFKKAVEIDRIEAFQSEYSLFSRAVEAELFPLAKEFNIGFMGWGPLDKGILTGRVTPNRTFDMCDARRKAPWWKNVDRTPKYNAMKRIAPLLKENGHTGLELALAYALRRKESSSALCGVRNDEQLSTAIEAIKNLPSNTLIDEALKIAKEEVTE